MKKITIGIYLDAVSEPVYLRKTLDFLSVNTAEKHEILLLGDGVNKQVNDTCLSISHRNISCSYTEEAQGRPACFNRLIRNDADIYIFLDCGVLVTKNWLTGLLNGLDASPGYGLAGPSSNNCWNEQCRFYDNNPDRIDKIRERADRLKQQYGDERETLEPLYSLAEFCFVVKKETVEAIGFADENYSTGYCWEMDYNIRAARAGFKGIWVKGVYVQRTNLNISSNQARDSSFLPNKHYYQDKFCALRAGNEATGYCEHCKGDDCKHFAPGKRMQIKPDNHFPPVNCIMPTKGRAAYVEQSVKYFLEQDYPNRELVIVYDEPGDIPGNLPRDKRIRLLQVEKGSSIGYKRNRACEIARGEIIAHWDDDDWYAKERLSRQIEPLIHGKADITALYNTIFFVPAKREFWVCTEKLYQQMFVEGVHGGTLVYKKDVWMDLARFPHTFLREDADFMVMAMRKGARLHKIDGYRLFMYLRHDKNSWRFASGDFLDPEGWKTVNEPLFFKNDTSFYYSTAAEQIKEKTNNTPVSVTIKEKPSPKVSCIMPTADRREFIAGAIRGFLRQDYKNKELIVVDDGEDKIADLIPGEANIKYIELPAKQNVGTKRNIACKEAAGEIIMHWDDDDWMAPGWITFQVVHLLREKADITGLDKPYFYSPEQGKAWQYIYPDKEKPWVHGGTLCYTRKLWDRNPFPVIDVAEDSGFLWSDCPKKVVPHNGVHLYIAVIHNNNTGPKYTSHKRWQLVDEERIRELMGDQCHLFPEISPGSNRTQKSDKKKINMRPIQVQGAKMNKKLIIGCAVLFCLFLITAVLFVNYYNEYHNLCRVIESGLSDTNKKKDLYERIVTQYEFMEFKIFSYEKKFPGFSRIVNKSFEESRKNKLSPYTVLSVIQVESNFDPFASSGVADGLMQINLNAWQDYFNIDKNKIYEIDYNIAIGCKILRHYLDKSGGDLSRALYLYNNGYGFHNKKYVPRVQNNRFSRKGR